MIGWLSGRIVDKEQLGHLVLDVNGVGYDVETSLNTFYQLESLCSQYSQQLGFRQGASERIDGVYKKYCTSDERDCNTAENSSAKSISSPEVSLHIHTVVREDAFILFGFLEKEERSLFRALIKVNGIGPKLALGILSSITPADFILSIRQQDIFRLTQVAGVGKKTAERLVIEMKDVVKNFVVPEGEAVVLSGKQSLLRRDLEEAVSALESLGYKHHEAVSTLKKVDNGTMNCEELIRHALKHFA